jgi:NarL family two-component system response regulator LiaR
MAVAEKIRIVVVDDHQLVRAGITALLTTQSDMEVIGEAANGKEALEKIKALTPDIVLMDISMPEMDGIRAAKQISELSPSTRVLMLTQHVQEEYVQRVMHSGIDGYILKNSLVAELTKAIRAVHEGKRYITPAISEAMAGMYLKSRKGVGEGVVQKRLTNREQEVLDCIAEGSSNLQIAAKLSISVRTVEFHRTNLMEKLGIHDTVKLVRYAIVSKRGELES